MVLSGSAPWKCLWILVKRTSFCASLTASNGLHHPRGDALGLAHVDRGADVLGEATAAVADAREEEMEADPLVVADAAADVVDVGAVGLAQVGHLVDEADLGRQQAVGDVLGHLGALGRHDQERPVGAEERGIERVQPLGDLLASHADDDAIGLVEVVDRGAFLEELGVARDVEGHLGDLGHLPGQLGVRADRDRALDHDDLRAGEVRGDLAADRPDAAQVGAAVGALRRPDGDEDDLGLGDPRAQVGREGQPAVARVAMDQLGQPRLVDRHLALLQALDLRLDLVDAHHVVAALGQAGALDQSHISRPDDCDLHNATPSRMRAPLASSAGRARRGRRRNEWQLSRSPSLGASRDAYGGNGRSRFGGHFFRWRGMRRKRSASETEKPGRTSPPSSD